MLMLRRFALSWSGLSREVRLLLVIALMTPMWLGVAGDAHAASFNVTSSADAHDAVPGDGICRANIAPAGCTLRAAIEEANALAGVDVVRVPAGTYTLTLGELTLTGDIEIVGAGAGGTFVEASSQPLGGATNVFGIRPHVVALITGLTVRNGKNGIQTSSDVQVRLQAVTISSNSGAGVSNDPSSRIAIQDSIISHNRTHGIQCFGEGDLVSTLSVLRSTITGNFATTAPGNLDGGGIYAHNCNVTVRDSTISLNSAQGEGGGFAGYDVGLHTFTNVTFSGNVAARGGGLRVAGLESWAASAAFENVTMANNRALESGGGHSLRIRHSSTVPRVSLHNSILVTSQASGPNCAFESANETRNISVGGNIEFPGQSCLVVSPPTGSVPDLSNVDPRLGALANNGGPTQTHALLATSPAIDRIPAASCPSTDQRGLPRPRDGNADGIVRCDVGAFEVQSAITGRVSPDAIEVAFQPDGRPTSEAIWTVPASLD